MATKTLQSTRNEIKAAREKARSKLHAWSQNARVLNTRESMRRFMGRQAWSGRTLTEPVRDIMTTAVNTCAPHEDLHLAASIMWDHDCGIVPIVDDGGRLVGVITDRDVCMAAYTQSVRLAGARIGASMSHDLVTCAPEDPISFVLELMADRRVRRIPVVSSNRALVGLVSQGDVASHIAGITDQKKRAAADHLLASTLACLSAPHRNGS